MGDFDIDNISELHSALLYDPANPAPPRWKIPNNGQTEMPNNPENVGRELYRLLENDHYLKGYADGVAANAATYTNLQRGYIIPFASGMTLPTAGTYIQTPEGLLWNGSTRPAIFRVTAAGSGQVAYNDADIVDNLDNTLGDGLLEPTSYLDSRYNLADLHKREQILVCWI